MLNNFTVFFQKLLYTITSPKVEKYLSYFVVLFAALLFTSQIGLSTPLRPYITDIDVFEGRVIQQYDSLIEEGTVTLGLLEIPQEKDIKILVNGNETACFDKSEVDIKVRNNSIIEVDASKIKNAIKVKIINKSNNVKNEIGKDITINSNIKVIDRIILK